MCTKAEFYMFIESFSKKLKQLGLRDSLLVVLSHF